MRTVSADSAQTNALRGSTAPIGFLPIFGVRPLQWGPYRTCTHSENLVVVGFASSPQPASDVHLLSYRSNWQICQTYQSVRFAQGWHNKREQSST